MPLLLCCFRRESNETLSSNRHLYFYRHLQDARKGSNFFQHHKVGIKQPNFDSQNYVDSKTKPKASYATSIGISKLTSFNFKS